jgi:phosphoglycolate phosphatase-like HAD superfamily hydrolase
MAAEQNSNGAQTLLIDADDTLWENNIYFERAIANFISFLNHHEYTPEQVREVLNQVERESIVSHGYGLHSFAHSLVATFERLAVEPLTPALHETINGFAHTIAGHPVELLPGVPETLQYLSERHHLILMTKGAVPEQTGKVERSGLKEYFSAVEIVSESGERIATATTDANGEFRFEAVPAGSYQLQVRSDGFQPFTIALQVTGRRALPAQVIVLALAAVPQDITVTPDVEPLSKAAKVFSGASAPQRTMSPTRPLDAEIAYEVVRTRYMDLRHFDPEAVNDHVRLLQSQRPLEVESGGIHQVIPWFSGKLDFAPGIRFAGDAEFPLRGGAVGYFVDRKAAALVYGRRLHSISLFVFKGDGLPWPSAGLETAGRAEVYRTAARGFNVLLWRDGELGYALVSDVSAGDLMLLASKLAPPA